jgi:molybdate/tungstate transport system substrate-binding protein
MPHVLRRRVTVLSSVLAVVAIAVALLPSVNSAAASGHKHSGPVDVLYAGSLVGLMQQGLGPAYDAETGYTFNGFSGGSGALATDIKGGTEVGDVFVSAAPSVNATLTGPSNGNWVSWYATFASSPLVIGYNPSSKFAAQLKSDPWYQVVTEPGFLMGRTDPATDPKGQLATQAMTQAATMYNEPALTSITSGTSNVYPEQSLVGLLQAGQLDAGFFYASEAAQAGIPTIPLSPIDLDAQYTVTVLNRAPDQAAADAFVAFLFSKLGTSILSHDGVTLVTPPTVTASTKVPKSLKSSLHAG